MRLRHNAIRMCTASLKLCRMCYRSNVVRVIVVHCGSTTFYLNHNQRYGVSTSLSLGARSTVLRCTWHVALSDWTAYMYWRLQSAPRELRTWLNATRTLQCRQPHPRIVWQTQMTSHIWYAGRSGVGDSLDCVQGPTANVDKMRNYMSQWYDVTPDLDGSCGIDSADVHSWTSATAAANIQPGVWYPGTFSPVAPSSGVEAYRQYYKVNYGY